MKTGREYIDLGSFTMIGDVMRVSDPCYDRDVWCCGTIKNCKVGAWEGMIAQQDDGMWGVRVSMVAAIHNSSTVGRAELDEIRTANVDEETGDWNVSFPKGWKDCEFESPDANLHKRTTGVCSTITAAISRSLIQGLASSRTVLCQVPATVMVHMCHSTIVRRTAKSMQWPSCFFDAEVCE